MAQRPVYIPQYNNKRLVTADMIDFTYHSGFAICQKQKSIESLHQAIQEKYSFENILEVSSKSKNPLGVALSAFNLMIHDQKKKLVYSVECAFQSSKVFENGGPYIDLLKVSSRAAKKDSRLKDSGSLLKFTIYNKDWGLEPLTAFYDWLYINALKANVQYHEELLKYDAFTDIEFNPKKSINCQAHAIAMFCSLAKKGLLEKTRDPNEFLDLYSAFDTKNIFKHSKLSNKKQQSISFF
jgi:hypothetical protein